MKIRSYPAFFGSLAVYGVALLILDALSNHLGLPTLIVIPLIIVVQVLYVITAPKRHLFRLSFILAILSLIAAPILYFALTLAIGGCCGAPAPNDSQELQIKSSFLVPAFGLIQFLFFKFTKQF